MTDVKALLSKLSFGTSVAEFDEDLESYFVETNTFREFVADKVDVIAGDKGTGKTAIYRFINRRHADIEELKEVKILPAFNPTGSPIFHTLVEQDELSETNYILLWKAYILSLVGNQLISENSDLKDSTLDRMLSGLGLKTVNVNPKGVFKRIIAALPNFFKWEAAETTFTTSPEGIPVVTARVEFTNDELKKIDAQKISVEDTFTVLDEAIGRSGKRVWVMFDRLDEAFHGHPNIEIAALRALLRTYLDLVEFENIKLKLFLRKDLFRRITGSSFVNLTHINAKKLEIIWDEEDLLNLLCSRVRQNPLFIEELDLKGATDNEIFDRMFPDQVDFGQRKPKTWVWMMRRIRDGNDVKPPRNLIDLVKFSREAQLRKEDREPRELSPEALIEPDALRRGLSQLSTNRVDDTLLAESGVYTPMIEKFRDGKAEHTPDTIATILEVPVEKVRSSAKPLVELGFLEEVKGTYKIPALYREGLSITQGRALPDGVAITTDDD